MIPLFKSQYSIGGRSILREDDIIRLHKESKEEVLYVVDDSLAGFRKVNNKAIEENIPFVFGLRISVVQDSLSEVPSKIVLFANNSLGIVALRKIYTNAFCKNDGILILNWLRKQSFLNNLTCYIPFYDSFIYNNFFYFGVSSLDLSGLSVKFFVENNNHPHDLLIRPRVYSFAPEKDILEVKSIFYEKREDFKAFQMFKAINNRRGGNSPRFDNPNVPALCSAEFCFESWKERNKKC